ncbi:MAG: (d)CMP kinase [Burkholderiaceae bacterium]
MTDQEPPPVVTIDGPTASGKGAVAQRLARHLGWAYLDSGALYRLVALMAARKRLQINDEAALADLAAQLPVRFDDDRIELAGEDVSLAIREPSVGNSASRIAVYPAVRAALLQRQRDFRVHPGLVADGRDMATVVFPDAPLKVYLTASVEMRANRRHKQLMEKGFSTKLNDIQADIAVRDERDANRAVAPLRPSEDSRIIDSSNVSLESVVSTVLDMVQELGLAST